MLKYTESDPYKYDKYVIHFVLIGICLILITIGALIYFY